MDKSLKNINKQINSFIEAGKQPELLIIGYKTYTSLMSEDRFAEKITKDETDPIIRYYKGIKIQMVAEKHYFKIK